MENTIQKKKPAAKEDAHLAVRMTDIRFRWKEQLPMVLDFQSLEVKTGEHFFVGGPSGSGKTTLLGLFAGILVPQAGEVELLGHRVDLLNSAERDGFRANHIGYIHQMFNLIPYLSVIENVTLPCRFSTLRKLRLKESPTADAQRLLNHLGLKETGLLARPVTELSVGQQQRVAAARALLGAPEIIIADEPTSALDAANRASFIELLFQECAETKATLVFVSHDASLGPMFDRTVQLEGGKAC